MMRTLFVSTYPPEECGLATFTKDTADAIDLVAGKSVSSVVAIQKTLNHQGKDPRIVHVIDNELPNAYRKAAEFANSGLYDIISLQHEFGLYAGDWGGQVTDFTDRCKKPIVTTFHTLLSQPDPVPKRIVHVLAEKSKANVVMSNTAAKLLVEVYGVKSDSVHVIPHGVPAVSFERDNSHRKRLDLVGTKNICTFGLINPGKGLEQMIRAMPTVVTRCPKAIYLIIGVTHPQVKREKGEAYRNGLIELANLLGVGNHVRFINKYLSLSELLSYLQSCDVFVTPYPGRDQIVSGTMAYAMATVGAVVSTPFLYAEELLANGRGFTVPFGDSESMANATLRFLTDVALLNNTRHRAYQYARPMFWPEVGRRYLELLNQVVKRHQPKFISIPNGKWKVIEDRRTQRPLRKEN